MTARPTTSEIARSLSRSDPVLRRLIRRTGPHPLPRGPKGFPALVRAIIYQQISGAAGDAIVRKIVAAHGRPGLPPAEWFLGRSDGDLRACGISPQKLRYLRDLSAQTLDGRLDFARLPRASDEEVIEHLTGVLGIGRWTAQMYLIFAMNRQDVLPTGYLGVQKAVQRAWGFKSLPAPRTMERLGRRWAPYRSHASYYLWRSLEVDLPVPPSDRNLRG